nr:gliding motility-associated C-terminal domain-containing protein [Chitinophaga nivalis]
MFIHIYTLQPLKLLIPVLVTILFSLSCFARDSTNVDVRKYAAQFMMGGFVRNGGQLKDKHNKSVTSILYTANIGQKQIYITRKGLSYITLQQLPVKEEKGKERRSGRNSDRPHRVEPDDVLQPHINLESVDVSLTGADIRPENIEETEVNRHAGVINMYDPRQADQQLQVVSVLKIKEVYPGIDWILYFNRDSTGKTRIKYDFLLAPHAAVSRIQLKYSANAHLSATPEGDILVKSKLDEHIEKAPVAFMEADRQPVKVNYRLRDKHTIIFEAEHYDTTRAMRIDPEIFWATFITTTQPDVMYQYTGGNDIEVDKDGNIFVQLTVSGTVPILTVNPGNGAYYDDISLVNNGAVAYMKFSPEGRLLWSTYFAGTKQTTGRVMTVDPQGNVYGIAHFYAAYGEVVLKDNGGYFDSEAKEWFVSKFDNNGRLLWSSYYAGFNTYPRDITYDEQGNIFIAGWSTSYQFPLADPGNGAYVQQGGPYGSARVLFISQFTPDCKLHWSTRMEGRDDDDATTLHADRFGNVYLGGGVRSDNYPLKNAGGYFYQDGTRVLTKFNSNREMVWSTYLHGEISAIVSDKQGNIYVPGGGCTLMKFDQQTNLVWTKTFSGPTQLMVYRARFDVSTDQIHLLGIHNGSSRGFPAKNTDCPGTFFWEDKPQEYPWNGFNPFFLTYNTAGDLQFATTVDWSTEYYEESDFTIDKEGNMIYLFFTNRNTQPNPAVTNPGNGAYYQPEMNRQGTSAFLMKLKNKSLTVHADVRAYPDCRGGGVIELQVACGKAPYQYAWSNGATTATVSDLAPGKYTVKVTDENKLSRTLEVILPMPPNSPSSFEVKTGDEYCGKKNGRLNIGTVTGGTAPFTYALEDQPFDVNRDFTGLSKGTYKVTVKDQNDCKVTANINIGAINGPGNFQIGTVATGCDPIDGQINIDNVKNGTPPYTYRLNDGDPVAVGSFTRLPAGDYRVKITDAAGCAVDVTAKVIALEPPAAANISTTDDHCGSGIGSILIGDITGGVTPYAYSVNGGNYQPAPKLDLLKKGSYTVAVKDGKGCVLTIPAVKIEDQDGPENIQLTVTDALCGKITGAIEIKNAAGTPPFKISLDQQSWSNANSLKGIPQGDHTLYVKDPFGCVGAQSFTVRYQLTPQLTMLPASTIICYGETVKLKVVSNYPELVKSLAWSIPEGYYNAYTATKIFMNSEEVTVTGADINGCILKATASINVKACNTPDRCVEVPTAFSPNGDGRNDRIGPLTLSCKLLRVNFVIYNRWGAVVFRSSSLDNKWDGYTSGQLQPGGSYVYVCHYIGEDQVDRQLSGAITLIR